MSIGLVVEEPSCQKFVEKIAERVGTSIDVVCAHGRGNLKRKLDDYVSLLEELPKVIVLVDSHCCPNPSQVENEFVPSARHHTNVHVCVVVHALESWLLADSTALSRKFRARSIRTPNSPESICKPEEELQRIYRRFNKVYRKTREPPLIR